MASALAGARSVRVQGWMAEECEAAALERLARHWPRVRRDPSKAYAVGRGAALDELRRLTGWRRRTRVSLVPLAPDDLDQPAVEPGFELVDAADELSRKLRRLRPRDQVITLRLAVGIHRTRGGGGSGRLAVDRVGRPPQDQRPLRPLTVSGSA